jgi:hypothetical protein
MDSKQREHRVQPGYLGNCSLRKEQGMALQQPSCCNKEEAMVHVQFVHNSGPATEQSPTSGTAQYPGLDMNQGWPVALPTAMCQPWTNSTHWHCTAHCSKPGMALLTRTHIPSIKMNSTVCQPSLFPTCSCCISAWSSCSAACSCCTCARAASAASFHCWAAAACACRPYASTTNLMYSQYH